MRYLFHLETDEDFGLRINGKNFLSKVKIRAKKDIIVSILRNAEIIETNPSKTKMAEEFFDRILGEVIFNSDGFTEGGNWEVRFLPLFDDEKNFDLDL